VKSFDWAKSRLEGVLTLPERRDLARRLMRNAVSALIESACFDRVAVVSRDDEALAFARELGAEAMREEGPPGLNEALGGARDIAMAEGATSLLVLFSDLPHVTAMDIRALVDASARCRVVIGPDRRAEGTNALLLRPPDAIDYAFGPGSFEKHLAAAAQAGLEVSVVKLPGVGHDVDVPDDLGAIEAWPASS
jgi:2-phospho-L-lactate guanylyltransferase